MLRAARTFMDSRAHDLNRDRLEALARELDAVRADVKATLGQRDLRHIRSVIAVSYVSAAMGRSLLHFGIGPVSFIAGVGCLLLAKVLDAMEVGHNVLHGQYDWSKDPALDSHTFEWDLACDPRQWRHQHNFEHHTYTSVLGKDRDIGYGFIRVAPEQPWRPLHVLQPFYATLLMLNFQVGIGVHDLRFDALLARQQTLGQFWMRAQPFLRKCGLLFFKDYIFFPLLAWANAPRVLLGNLLANGLRNIWGFMVIFCGHFADGVEVFEESQCANESRGEWYVRQIHGSANLSGGRLFSLFTGHLSHQIEHHIFPDIPSARYFEIAPRVQEICERHGVRYNTGSLRRQFGSVVRAICRYSWPNRAPAAARATA